MDDLAIGIPYDYDDRGYNSGAVLVTYGYLKKTSPPKPHRYSLDTTDIVGAEHPATAPPSPTTSARSSQPAT